MTGAFDPTLLRPDIPAYGCGSMSIQQGGENLTVPGLTGLTARQHAAIALRVPDSGSDWLDGMIRASLRDSFAMAAMQGILSSGDVHDFKLIHEAAYSLAGVMLGDM